MTEEKTPIKRALEECSTVDEYVEYFTADGFKCVKDIDSELSRTLTFRSFVDGDALEVVIKQIGSHVSVKQTVNGIPV